MSFATAGQPRNLLLLGLLVAFCLYTAASAWLPLMPSSGQYATSLLSGAHYAGFAAVAGCCLSYFAHRRFFKLALGSTLLLALFNLLHFLPGVTSAGINLGEVHLGVDPLMVPMVAAFYLFNRPTTHRFIRRYILPAPTPQQASRQRREDIEQFKQTFARKPTEALQLIVQERKLVPDALAAAQELLHERDAAEAPPQKLREQPLT